MFALGVNCFLPRVCVCVRVCCLDECSLKLCAFLKLPSASSSAAVVTFDPVQSASPSPPSLLLHLSPSHTSTDCHCFCTEGVYLARFVTGICE